jgi:LPPG:FO 2-phospho-L-lactate transferase
VGALGIKVLALSGGVGGAKLVLGLSRVLASQQLVVCANTADDFTHLGLRVCPDLDTIMYTLAGINNPQQGWGIAGESWQFMQSLRRLGGATWFNLGDQDLATHVLRTDSLARGLSLSRITGKLCRSLDIAQCLLPMSDDPVATLLDTDEGTLTFQDYFVRRRCQPAVQAYRFAGVESARVQPELLSLLGGSDLAGVVICPSNPFVSVEPILALPGMRLALQRCKAPVIAVSPIVGGKALKGPAAKMMRELRQPASALQIARFYRGLVDGMVIDCTDACDAAAIEGMGMACLVTPTVMRNLQDKTSLAERLLQWLHSHADGLQGGAI